MKIKAGDIFQIETQSGIKAFAQVLVSEISLYICIFPPQDAGEDSIPEDLGTPLFIGWTQDAFFFHGRWKILGNCDVPEGIRTHIFSVSQEGKKYIADFRGKFLCEADPSLKDLPPLQFSLSPIGYVRALESYMSGALEERFERILYQNVRPQTHWCEDAPNTAPKRNYSSRLH